MKRITFCRIHTQVKLVCMLYEVELYYISYNLSASQFWLKKNKNNNNKTVIYHPESTTNFVQKKVNW